MRGSEFVFDGVNALYYDPNKISLIRVESYIDSPEWLIYFQYALTVALNY